MNLDLKTRKENKTIKGECDSCIECRHSEHYFPTADSFDMDYVLVCKKTDRVKPKNEIGYGRNSEDFQVPEWCPKRFLR